MLQRIGVFPSAVLRVDQLGQFVLGAGAVDSTRR